jgi:hypothetical protein
MSPRLPNGGGRRPLETCEQQQRAVRTDTMAQPRAPAVAAPQLLQLQLLLLAASSGSANDPLPVHILDAAASTASGAVCLDGSPPGFYFGAATSAATSNNWVIYFKGGAWCVRHDEASDLANCLSRSQTQLGSSTLFAPTFQFSGMLDSDPAINPDFATWNRVILMYCDGASFSGDRDDPVVVDGTPLYFRGHRVLDALLDELLTPAFGLNRAEQVLLAGGSAGGLATFLHTDFVRSKMPPSVRTFKAAPVSGFFLQHDTQQMIDNPRMASSNPQQFSVVEGVSFPAQMRRVFEMQHCAGGVSQACIAAQPKGEEWRCMMAAPTLAAATVPTFVINSAADSWQLGNILKLPHGPPDTCSRVGFGGCDETQLSQIQSYMDDFVADLRATAAFQRPVRRKTLLFATLLTYGTTITSQDRLGTNPTNTQSLKQRDGVLCAGQRLFRGELLRARGRTNRRQVPAPVNISVTS